MKQITNIKYSLIEPMNCRLNTPKHTQTHSTCQCPFHHFFPPTVRWQITQSSKQGVLIDTPAAWNLMALLGCSNHDVNAAVPHHNLWEVSIPKKISKTSPGQGQRCVFTSWNPGEGCWCITRGAHVQRLKVFDMILGISFSTELITSCFKLPIPGQPWPNKLRLIYL